MTEAKTFVHLTAGPCHVTCKKKNVMKQYLQIQAEMSITIKSKELNLSLNLKPE